MIVVVLHGGALLLGTHAIILIDRTFKRVALMEACLKNDETIRKIYAFRTADASVSVIFIYCTAEARG